MLKRKVVIFSVPAVGARGMISSLTTVESAIANSANKKKKSGNEKILIIKQCKESFFRPVEKGVTFKALQKVRIPFRLLRQYDLIDFVKKLIVPDLRRIYMKYTLPNKSLNIKCGILNLDLNDGKGTHWTSWYTSNAKIIIYFNSYGATSSD